MWASEPASDVLLQERAVVCNATTNDTGFGGTANVWFPGSVIEATNMALKAGEAAGFVRVKDSWSSSTVPAEPNDARSATLSNGEGHEVQLNVHSSARFGSYISLRVRRPSRCARAERRRDADDVRQGRLGAARRRAGAAVHGSPR